MAEFEPIWSLGLMSGTSLDGVDAALLRTDGEGIAEFGLSSFLPYREGDLRALPRIMADWRPFRPAADDDAAATLDEAEHEVLAAHAAAASILLTTTPDPTDLIGFHGQTVAHAPEEGWTWQLGDGAALARALNRPVAWDFRSADMQAGGQGAPLAPFFHFALALHIGATEPLAFLNIGGVGNVTWIDPAAEAPEAPGALLAFDTGPGNALINDWMRRKTGKSYDDCGAAAAAGRVDVARLRSNAAQAFLDRPPPKSLDRNEFQPLLAAMDGLGTEDGAATLTAFTVDCIAAALGHMPRRPCRWLVCGGGRRNAAMMAMLAERLTAPVSPVEDAGLDGDMLEAQAFAWLAVRALRSLPLSAPGTTGCAKPTTGGRISAP